MIRQLCLTKVTFSTKFSQAEGTLSKPEPHTQWIFFLPPHHVLTILWKYNGPGTSSHDANIFSLVDCRVGTASVRYGRVVSNITAYFKSIPEAQKLRTGVTNVEMDLCSDITV